MALLGGISGVRLLLYAADCVPKIPKIENLGIHMTMRIPMRYHELECSN